MAHSSTCASAPAGPTPAPPTSSATQHEKPTQYASILPPTPLDLHRTTSLAHADLPSIAYIPTGDNDAKYGAFSERRKTVIVAVMSFCSFLAPVSSTTVLSAVPEVAATFGTDGSVINVSNALYMLFMGLSPCFWGPFGNVYGRRWVCD